MIAVSSGMGTNSTAMLVGMYERGIRPDLIIFADTGGEMPHTYRHISAVSKWLSEVGFPELTTVKKVDSKGDVLTLEDDCLRKKMLPSIAYGFKSCSQKYKIQPQDKFMNNLEAARRLWKSGGKITKVIGFDAGESRRAEKDYSCNKYNYWYPLIEWGWGREECVDAIKRAGLPQPGKSSCFFCPNSRKSEILEMAEKYPDLIERALLMEKNAELTHIAGLGRRYSWKELIATSNDMFGYDYNEDMPCGCYDG